MSKESVIKNQPLNERLLSTLYNACQDGLTLDRHLQIQHLLSKMLTEKLGDKDRIDEVNDLVQSAQLRNLVKATHILEDLIWETSKAAKAANYQALNKHAEAQAFNPEPSLFDRYISRHRPPQPG